MGLILNGLSSAVAQQAGSDPSSPPQSQALDPAAPSPVPEGATTEPTPSQETILDTEDAGSFIAPGVNKAALPHDLSPWGMFLAADIVVKAVMVSLAFASVLTWTVWLAKSIELLGAKRRTSQTLGALNDARSLHDAEKMLYHARGASTDLVRAARAELTLSDALASEGIKERLATTLSRIEARAGRTMTKGTGLLATMGSTAPFVGLFGTVWGIMNAFIGISKSQTTNLAVVAPGIAEALLATALGLVVAIPAVMIYNVFARAIAGYRASLSDVSAGVMKLVSRDLDRQALNHTTPSSRPAERASFGRVVPAE
ncbi:tonB-system energizer ExbB [Rhodoligotrophos appendicifer]